MRLHRRSANYREIDPRVWTRGSLVLGNGGLLGGYGNEERKNFPLEGKLAEWLWRHPEVREELWKRMEESAGSDSHK